MCWRDRVEIPLEALRSQQEKLQDWPRDQTLHPGDVMNRDPNVTKEKEAEHARMVATCGSTDVPITSDAPISSDESDTVPLGILHVPSLGKRAAMAYQIPMQDVPGFTRI